MNTELILDTTLEMDELDHDFDMTERAATQIAYTADNGRELVRWGAPGIKAERLAASLPEGTVWREVSREEGEAIVAFVPLDDAKIRKLADIDRETAAAILTGFDHEVDGVSYHFSYDERDQQNFADAANMVLLARLEGADAPEQVWNGRQGNASTELAFTGEAFLALYRAAVAHKNACLESGRTRKEAAMAAIDADSLAAV